MEDQKIAFEDIERAAQNLIGKVRYTPLQYSRSFSELSGRQVLLKCENLQITGSFKVRGAFNKLLSLTVEEQAKGVVAASAGNHAQGVALASAMSNVKATIVMPQGAPIAKVEATKAYGADVILHGHSYDEAYEHALAIQAEKGSVFVHAFDDPKVIAGQGVVGLEILQQCKNLDGIVVPVGGGGLIGGIALAVKTLFPQVAVVGVQTSAAPAMVESKKEKKHKTVACKGTIADGIAVACPGQLNYGLVEQLIDDMVAVDEDDIARTVVLLLERAKLVTEGAGAAALSALLTGQVGKQGERWVTVLSGGNMDITTVAKIIEQGLVRSGRRWEFRTVLPDRPGALQSLLAEVAQGGANIIAVNHDRLRPGLALSQAEVLITLETRDQDHIKELIARLGQRGYITKEANFS
ncbi:threonine ammonia-lyase [Heliorestis acidaminivorans]|uniref:threonine ammonia-lyase n=1 Tax=Heliorestis acidaminivorans TaxID=553427 RepID=A0A6I0ESY2_9FIRM|nr:threonine ammonia-lyase [Heliorestis acidaminivorans]KAB2953028.1 threonine ammonia-lyase [Heliorestis acidaminivorans]